MSPPVEQLIRDYLNRLSVAARGHLNPDDRKALVDRARDFIERNASSSGQATSMQVAALLARLGDPAVLVGQAAARLAAIRGEPSVPPAAVGRMSALRRRNSGQASWHWPRPTGSQDLQARLLKGWGTDVGQSAGVQDVASLGETGAAQKPSIAKRARPRARLSLATARPADAAARQGQPAGRQDTTGQAETTAQLGDPGPRQAAAGQAESTAQQGQPGAQDLAHEDQLARQQDEAAGEYDTREPPIWIPRQSAAADQLTATAADKPHRNGLAGPGGPSASAGAPNWPSVVARSIADAGSGARTADANRDRDAAAQEQVPPVGPAPWRPPRARSALLAALLGRARRNPLETIAVILLGLGGVIYPPVWLLGAIFALACPAPPPPAQTRSRGSGVWDYRDKWIGLAAPVVLLVVGTTAGVSLGRPHPYFSGYVHEAWIYADIISRVAAVLGTSYLVWRLGRGRRVPRELQWTSRHKPG